MRTSLILLLFVALLFPPEQACSQKISVGLAGELFNQGLQVRAQVDLGKRFRAGVDYTDYLRKFNGWTCIEKVHFRSWYAGANLAYLFVDKEKWALYALGGIGAAYSHRYSTKSPELYRPYETLDLAFRIGGGGEYRVNRWRFFGELFLAMSHDNFYEYPTNGVLGVSYLLSNPN